MVDGKIAFQMGSTVPTLERADLVLPRKEEEVEVKQEITQPAADDEAEPAKQVEDNTAVPESKAAAETEQTGNDLTETAQNTEPANMEIETTDDAPPPKRPRTRVPASRPTLPLPSSLFIGDLRLTVLRTRLQALNPPIPAEFAGSGILVCGPGVLALANQGEKGNVVKAGSIVAVRKGEKGVEIEGSVGSVYDLVKREVYGSLAQVSAA
jgi:cleavage and polyadenylation specificity factor subunit 2